MINTILNNLRKDLKKKKKEKKERKARKQTFFRAIIHGQNCRVFYSRIMTTNKITL